MIGNPAQSSTNSPWHERTAGLSPVRHPLPCDVLQVANDGKLATKFPATRIVSPQRIRAGAHEAGCTADNAMRDWEAHYQAGDMPWDKGEAAPPLRELVARMHLEVFCGGPVLVPGCGLGHDVRELARMGVDAVGLDLSPTAVRMASELTSDARATFQTGDFLDPAWRRAKCFASVWEHTCFCAISPDMRADYAEAVADILPLGGVFAGVFYLQPSDPVHPGMPPFGATIEELDACFAPCFDRVAGWIPQDSYASRAGREWLAVFRKIRSL